MISVKERITCATFRSMATLFFSLQLFCYPAPCSRVVSERFMQFGRNTARTEATIISFSCLPHDTTEHSLQANVVLLLGPTGSEALNNVSTSK